MMDIQILELLEGARYAAGLTAVIDVFRAFSLEAWLFARGAGQIFAVGSEETARRMKSVNPDALLIGERGGKILPGFDYGNSPFQTADAPLAGRTVIHTTSAGTQGLAAASGASGLLAASLVTASAAARYISRQQPHQVSLVVMGLSGKSSTPEDLLCARYIKSLLEGTPFDLNRELAALRNTAEGRKFFNPQTQNVFPREDFDLCTAVDRFSFVIVAEKTAPGVFRMKRTDIPV
ncbi:MAG: 2-phosphosulfolactate phosphatase [Pyramidobacter sp.]|jgi:2-phosphosulfolactate phosphatase